MKKEDLLTYEAPSICEHISWNFFQTILGKYIAWKINKKWKRYQTRLMRKVFLFKL